MALIVVTRYLVPEVAAATFAEQAGQALAALRAQPGFIRGHVGRALDEVERWLLQTEWQSTGGYRRALSSYDVKIRAVPLMYQAIDEATAYEVLTAATVSEQISTTSDRSPQADTSSLGRRGER